jgi:two-component system, sensor histidine kinase and response regulator
MQEKANILLVDDHLSNLVALEGMLETLGQNLIRASSGEEALLHLLEHEFAVILLDVQMSNLDGFETAALIKQRERTKSIPIIFITAIHRDEQHVYRGYTTGAVDYLFKPVVPDILRAKVSVFVELYQKTREIQAKTAELETMNREYAEQLNYVQVLNRKLEAVNLELESFSYSVSHDLRAPLRSIKGFSQALARNYNNLLDTEGKDFLSRIIESCEQMGSLIDDLLQLSRVIRGKVDVQVVNLAEIAGDILDDLQKSNPQRHVQVNIQKDLIANADVRLMRVVLDNLLGNAWKFTRDKANAKIEMGSEWQENRCIFFVRDNGAGFDMAYSEQLFQPFQRLHTEDEFEGNGVGLATVQRIVHRHGGEIWAVGEVEQGATFYFTLGDEPV